jgi:hypothetical protein
VGLLDYIDEDSSLFGGLFGSANSSPPVPPANIPGDDTSAMSTPVALAGGAGGIAPQGQISPALPQWVQTAQDPNRSAPPMAGLTQAQFNDRFGPVAKGSSPSGFSQSPAPSAVDDTSRFSDAKFDPQTYAGRSVSPSWEEHATYHHRLGKGFGEYPIPVDDTSATYMPTFAQIESTGNPTKQNGNAVGLMQFMPDTWLGIKKNYFGIVPRDDEDMRRILVERNNPALSTFMAKILAAENAKTLNDKGVATTPSSSYLAHFLGAPAAVKVLKADPTTPLESLLSEDAIDQNKLSGKTAGRLIDWSKKRTDDASETSRKPAKVQYPLRSVAPVPFFDVSSRTVPRRRTIDLSKLQNTLKTSGNPTIFLGR